MDNNHCSTTQEERKSGRHLSREERGAIQHLKKLGYSNRAIAREINCSPSTIGYELRRGTLSYCGKGRKPNYSAKRGEAAYQSNRLRCKRRHTYAADTAFMSWIVSMIRIHHWSFDTCVGRARLEKRFEKQDICCTKTLYNMLWKGDLPITLFELPEVLGRRKRGRPRIPKRTLGRSIEQRPSIVDERTEFGHWESDTVVGKKRKGEAAIFTIVERLTGYYLSIRIDGKTCDGVHAAMGQLREEYGERFSEVFRTITTDNGSEFASFSSMEAYGTKVFFAHPYSSWERPVNERSNRILRRFIPKGKSITPYTAEQIQMVCDEMNAIPRSRLGYRSAEELFDAHLDSIYAQ